MTHPVIKNPNTERPEEDDSPERTSATPTTAVDIAAFETQLATYPGMIRAARARLSEQSMKFAEAIAGTGPSNSFFTLGALIGGQVPGMGRINEDWYEEEAPIYSQWLEAVADAATPLALAAECIDIFYIPNYSNEELRKKYEPVYALACDVHQQLAIWDSLKTHELGAIRGSTSQANSTKEKWIGKMRDILDDFAEPLSRAIEDVLERKVAPLNVNFSTFMREAANARHAMGRTGDFNPSFYQDGGAEIHPDLQGITFQFFTHPDSQVPGVAVNYAGEPASGVPWAARLTGHVFENFEAAKTWLRQEAARLASEEK